MMFELDKRDIIRLIRGTTPSYEKMTIFKEAGLGDLWGGHDPRWEWEADWSDAWEKYSEKDLYDLYKYNLKPSADEFISIFTH